MSDQESVTMMRARLWRDVLLAGIECGNDALTSVQSADFALGAFDTKFGELIHQVEVRQDVRLNADAVAKAIAEAVRNHRENRDL